jgi:hypothetical protein
MAGEKIMNGAASTSRSQPNGLMEEIGSFGADLASLAVLQGRLAACEAREAAKEARIAVLLLAISGMVFTSGLVAIFLGAASLLAARFGIEPGTAMVLSGLAGLLITAAIVFFSARSLLAMTSLFQRSHEELERNLAWIRTTLSQSGR